MKLKQYSNDLINTWNEFNKNSKNGIFMFDRGFMDYHSDRFQDNSLMFYDEKDELVALLPLNIKNNILYSHGGLTYGGFITNSSMKQVKMLDCYSALKDYMRENNIKECIYKTLPYFYHKLPAQEDIYALFLNNAKIEKIEPASVIYLKEPIKMPKGRKAQISRARREGVQIEQSTDFETFINLENSVLQEKHNTKAVHTAQELELLHSRFGNEIKLFAAKYNGEIIAASLIFEYENTVHTQYLAANDKAREIGALDLLIKTLIDEYSETKTYFDFGISTEDGGRFLNEGLISQKEGFGARTIAYCTYKIGV